MTNGPDVEHTRPALAPEEWADILPELPIAGKYSDVLYGLVSPGLPLRPDAIAGVALYGQPGGFTWADVDRCRRMAEALQSELDDPNSERYDDGALFDEIREWQSLADRLAALLPPRELVK